MELICAASVAEPPTPPKLGAGTGFAGTVVDAFGRGALVLAVDTVLISVEAGSAGATPSFVFLIGNALAAPASSVPSFVPNVGDLKSPKFAGNSDAGLAASVPDVGFGLVSAPRRDKGLVTADADAKLIAGADPSAGFLFHVALKSANPPKPVLLCLKSKLGGAGLGASVPALAGSTFLSAAVGGAGRTGWAASTTAVAWGVTEDGGAGAIVAGAVPSGAGRIDGAAKDAGAAETRVDAAEAPPTVEFNGVAAGTTVVALSNTLVAPNGVEPRLRKVAGAVVPVLKENNPPVAAVEAAEVGPEFKETSEGADEGAPAIPNAVGGVKAVAGGVLGAFVVVEAALGNTTVGLGAPPPPRGAKLIDAAVNPNVPRPNAPSPAAGALPAAAGAAMGGKVTKGVAPTFTPVIDWPNANPPEAAGVVPVLIPAAVWPNDKVDDVWPKMDPVAGGWLKPANPGAGAGAVLTLVAAGWPHMLVGWAWLNDKPEDVWPNPSPAPAEPNPVEDMVVPNRPPPVPLAAGAAMDEALPSPKELGTAARHKYKPTRGRRQK